MFICLVWHKVQTSGDLFNALSRCNSMLFWGSILCGSVHSQVSSFSTWRSGPFSNLASCCPPLPHCLCNF